MDDDISLFELKNHINLRINNSTISNYLINEFKNIIFLLAYLYSAFGWSIFFIGFTPFILV